MKKTTQCLTFGFTELIILFCAKGSVGKIALLGKIEFYADFNPCTFSKKRKATFLFGESNIYLRRPSARVLIVKRRIGDFGLMIMVLILSM